MKLQAQVVAICLAVAGFAAGAADMSAGSMSKGTAASATDSKGMTKDEMKDKKDMAKSGDHMQKGSMAKGKAADTKGMTKDEMKDKTDAKPGGMAK